jgi:hypothetical protein
MSHGGMVSHKGCGGEVACARCYSDVRVDGLTNGTRDLTQVQGLQPVFQ